MQSAFTFLVGALLSLCCGAGAVYGMLLVRGSWWGLNASAPGAILLFFILTCFVNTVCRKTCLARWIPLFSGLAFNGFALHDQRATFTLCVFV